MKTPLSWLNQYVELPPLNQLIERMNQTGTTVEQVETFGEGIDEIVVGEILEVRPHPNADRLKLAKVKLPGKTLEIVCGAPNIAVGQKVPVAQVGTSVPVGPNNTPMKIERAKIRGAESEGMLCSARELGLGEDHSGILILDPNTKIGTKLSFVLDLPDTILETEVTTNRGDELSVYGLARELGAITNAQVKPLKANKISLETTTELPLKVSIDGNDLCIRYAAVVVSGIKLGPSPAFIQTRLRESGMRPIGNVVDITNYVMLLMGQPLHAFDYDKVAENHILVRESKAGDRVVTLDGQLRQLGFESIVISDPKKILGLAGVMGGEEESVTETTTSIVLESAVFNPKLIRQTVMKHGLRSEASHRFERGVDPTYSITALELAVELLKKYADGVVASKVVDIYPNPYQSREVSLSLEKLDQYLGYDAELSEAARILSKLGFKKTSGSLKQLTCLVPSHRAHDIFIEEDLIEEVARILGYDSIPEILPGGEIRPIPPNPILEQIKQTKQHLSSIGYNEVYTYSFISEALVGADKTLRITNPISKEWEYLRTSLVPGLALTAMSNINWSGEFRIFELSKVYLQYDEELPSEPYRLAVVGEDFHELKGVVESLCEFLNIKTREYQLSDPEDLEYLTQAADILIEGQLVGRIGQLNRNYSEKTDLKKELAFAELDFESLMTLTDSKKTFPEIPKYPSIKEDLSIIVNLETPIAELVTTVKNSGSKTLIAVEPVDVFIDEDLGTNKKSVSLRLFFQSKEKTLTTNEVRLEREKIEKYLRQKLSAKIR